MEAIMKLIAILLLGLVFALLMTIPVWLLWNWLMPVIFGLKTITFIQAFGVSLLSNTLFKGGGSSCKSE